MKNTKNILLLILMFSLLFGCTGKKTIKKNTEILYILVPGRSVYNDFHYLALGFSEDKPPYKVDNGSGNDIYAFDLKRNHSTEGYTDISYYVVVDEDRKITETGIFKEVVYYNPDSFARENGLESPEDVYLYYMGNDLFKQIKKLGKYDTRFNFDNWENYTWNIGINYRYAVGYAIEDGLIRYSWSRGPK